MLSISSGEGQIKSASSASPSKVIFVNFGTFTRGSFGILERLESAFLWDSVGVGVAVFFSSRFWLFFFYAFPTTCFCRLSCIQLSLCIIGSWKFVATSTSFFATNSTVLNFGVSTSGMVDSCDFSSSMFFVSSRNVSISNYCYARTLLTFNCIAAYFFFAFLRPFSTSILSLSRRFMTFSTLTE